MPIKSERVAGSTGIGAVKSLLAVMLVTLLFGCETSMENILPDRKVDYKRQAGAGGDLEVPPDLSADGIGNTMVIPGASTSGSATYSEYEERVRGGQPGYGAATGGTVLPEMEAVRVARDGDQRWLEIDASPDQVWPQVVSFWRQNGVLLAEQNPTTGVMKTDWLENRADIKGGFITELIRSTFDGLYSSATRDQFRVRLEPGAVTGSTDLYLTHRGMEEEFSRDSVGNEDQTIWVPRENDPGLEAEMLRRLMVHLGVADAEAKSRLASAEDVRQSRSELVTGRGGAYLLVHDEFAPAWRLVGVALERAGFLVEDRDRSAGVYYVRYDDPTIKKEEGFFSKMAFWRDSSEFDEEIVYRVSLREDANETRVVIQDEEGQVRHTDTTQRILTMVQEQIR